MRSATTLMREMPLARRAALVLALGLVTVVAFAAPVDAGEGQERHGGTGTDVAFVARHDGLQAANARLDREYRRDSLGSHRSAKHLVLVALLLTALLVGPGPGRRRTVTGAGFRPPLSTRWFRSGGRAPPYIQLPVV